METLSDVYRIFVYLREIQKLNEKIIRTVASYDKVIWLSENFDKEGFKFHETSPFSESWFTIKKQVIEEPPELPGSLTHFLDPSTDIHNPLIQPKHLVDFTKESELFTEWEKWFGKWVQWSSKNTEKFKTQQLYEKIFAIDQIIRKQTDILELVVGHGILSWSIGNTQVLHPVFVTKLSIDFDAQRGIFVLKPATDETKIELEMLDNLDIPNRDKLQELKNKIIEEGRDPRNFEDILPDLKEITNFLSSKGGEVKPELIGNSIPVNTNPVIYNAPILILRKFDSRLWIREINGIIKSIEEGYPIPKTIESLTINGAFSQDPETSAEWKLVGEDLLFPLQANEEQKEIARRLANDYGVVVQGPPGTGKSHTIANLICHLLANGKRVLVTSQTEKALNVLAEKIPEAIRPLCINVAGGDIGSLRNLEQSIRSISDQLQADPASIKVDIKHLTDELDKTRRKIAESTSKLRDTADIEANYRYNFEGTDLALQEISKFLQENENKIFSIEDSINLNESCPMTQSEFERLLDLFENEKENKEIIKFYDLISKIPVIDKISTTINQFLDYQEFLQSQDLSSIESWEIVENQVPDFNALSSAIETSINNLNRIQRPWILDLIKPCSTNPIVKDHVSKIVEELEKAIASFEEKRKLIQLKEIQIAIPIVDDKSYEQFCRDFAPWYKSLKETGTIGFLVKITNKKSSYILEKSRINNTEIDTSEKAELLKQYADYQFNQYRLEYLWKRLSNQYGGSSLDLNKFEDHAELLKNIDHLKTILLWNENCLEEINPLMKAFRQVEEIDLFTKSGLTNLRKNLNMISLLDNYETLKKEIESFANLLAEYHELFVLLGIQIDENYLRSLERPDRSKIKNYLGEIYGSLFQVQKSQREFIELLSLKDRLSTKFPLFIHKLESEASQQNLKTKYVNFPLSWRWNLFHQIYTQTHLLSIEKIEEEILSWKQKERKNLQNLVAKRTWHNRILQTKREQKTSLQAWLKAIKKIGKGTGKLAPHHRKTAQKEMENCKGAIPVWIMPLHRIVENISLQQDEMFDVIIFDESSQSDIFALCALFRAKKAVIVGDDQQISPYAIGSDSGKILELNKLYLKGIPHSELFDMKTSLYDYGQLIFTSNLMLKEHFRCVPDIIQFSNDLCYGGEIIPLRFPEKKEIFDPAVVAVRIKDGYKDEMKNVNNPEAEAIVEEIARCCSDPQYDGMTMGVISLLGENQANVIQDFLRKKIGDEEYFTRKIVCGDAYAFQGDERDLMFLSLVVAPNARFAALTKDDDIRRFNVAASRAKNREWLFHSVDLSDLNQNCVRYQLLSYFIDPGRVKKDIKKLEYLFESGFEKDVFKLIESQGYSISPQVHVGKYRIDMVVEGLRNRLAIECDGDSWHGVDQWDKDWERQQQLERVGWKFCRIRASEFYRDPRRAIQPVLKKIEEMGIEKGLDLKQTVDPVKSPKL